MAFFIAVSFQLATPSNPCRKTALKHLKLPSQKHFYEITVRLWAVELGVQIGGIARAAEWPMWLTSRFDPARSTETIARRCQHRYY